MFHFHFPRFYGSTLGKGSYLALKAIVIPHIRDIQLETKAKFGNYVWVWNAICV